MKRSISWRELALFCLPCLFLLIVGKFISQRPTQTKLVSNAPLYVAPTPTPPSLYLEMRQFELEKVTPRLLKMHADTCILVETIPRNAPVNPRWYRACRLVALKQGKAKVLWNDWFYPYPDGSPLASEEGGYNGHWRRLGFNLRKVPPTIGDIFFVFDTVVRFEGMDKSGYQPSPSNCTPQQLGKIAKLGGARMTRRLLVRRDGEQTPKPTFAASTDLQIKNAIVKRLPKADENGNEFEVTLFLLYTGKEEKPRVFSEDGLVVYDERHKMIERSSNQDYAQQVGNGRLYSLLAGYKAKDWRGAKRVLVTADVHDGQNWLLNGRAFATVPAEK